MLEKLILKFTQDWPVYWTRLGVGAAMTDGPKNEKETTALLRYCTRVCGSLNAQKIWKAFGDSPVRPEDLPWRTPKQSPEVLASILNELLSVMCADGVLNEAELNWIKRFQQAAALEHSVMDSVFYLYYGRDYQADNPDAWLRVLVVVIESGEWIPVAEIEGQPIAVCTGCNEKNQLPSKSECYRARCKCCNAYLALTMDQAQMRQQQADQMPT